MSHFFVCALCSRTCMKTFMILEMQHFLFENLKFIYLSRATITYCVVHIIIIARSMG